MFISRHKHCICTDGKVLAFQCIKKHRITGRDSCFGLSNCQKIWFCLFAGSLSRGWNFWLSQVQGARPRCSQGLWIYCSCRKDRVYFSSTDIWWQLKHSNGTWPKKCVLSVLPLISVSNCFLMKKEGGKGGKGWTEGQSLLSPFMLLNSKANSFWGICVSIELYFYIVVI